MLDSMDQNNTTPASTAAKNTNLRVIIVCCIVCLLIAIPAGLIGYQTGYAHGKQLAVVPPVVKPLPKKEITSKHDDDDDDEDEGQKSENAPGQENSYNVFYTPPAGWRAMVWHPDPDSVGSALFSPDYTSIEDPTPQTGLSVLIYQFPGQFNSMEQLRPAVEETEEGLLSLTQTTIAGYSAYRSEYDDSDSGRYLNDYDILKGHDRWLVRIDFPGTSYAAMQQEEQKYSIQINQLLQSIQFKTIQYQ